MLSKIVKIGAYLYILICIQGCKLYKFTDASVNPNLKTIAVNNIPNLSPIVVPSLSNTVTEGLKDKFLRETNLKLSNIGADIEFNGSIIQYNIDPVSITNVATVAQNRLTISIKIECTNRVEPLKGFSQTFTDGENYDATKDLNSIEDDLITTITDRIIQNIFNKAFVNW
ncbi:MAG: LptE family protein [Bacteroidetes bacterium]|jgi:hypothetical protein|nr:LptE family protein [Bacteroidota bacterium]MBL0078885.1 LptE family protein [Bacteroidota bacterium]MBP7257856.1 LptE family protein [Chitinophagales bacterium]MBP9136652.1 LptE family protein [Chitinophagales bacterium]